MLNIKGIEKLMGKLISTATPLWTGDQWMIREVREAEGNKYRIYCHKLNKDGSGPGFVEFVLIRQSIRSGVYRLYNDAFSPNKIEVKIDEMQDLDSFIEVLRSVLMK
jgi:hypothetical protein